MQDALVLVIVAVAGAFVFYKLRSSAKSGKCSGGCGGNCGKDKDEKIKQ